MEILKESNLIEDNSKILSNSRFHNTQKLTIRNISEGFILYEKFSL